MADPEILRYLASTTGLGLKYLSKDEKVSILYGMSKNKFTKEIYVKLKDPKKTPIT